MHLLTIMSCEHSSEVFLKYGIKIQTKSIIKIILESVKCSQGRECS